MVGSSEMVLDEIITIPYDVYGERPVNVRKAYDFVWGLLVVVKDWKNCGAANGGEICSGADGTCQMALLKRRYVPWSFEEYTNSSHKQEQEPHEAQYKNKYLMQQTWFGKNHEEGCDKTKEEIENNDGVQTFWRFVDYYVWKEKSKMMILLIIVFFFAIPRQMGRASPLLLGSDVATDKINQNQMN